MSPGLRSQTLHVLAGPGKRQQAFVFLSEGFAFNFVCLGECKKQSVDVSLRSCLHQRSPVGKEQQVSLSACCHCLPEGCRCSTWALNATWIAVSSIAVLSRLAEHWHRRWCCVLAQAASWHRVRLPMLCREQPEPAMAGRVGGPGAQHRHTSAWLRPFVVGRR